MKLFVLLVIFMAMCSEATQLDKENAKLRSSNTALVRMMKEFQVGKDYVGQQQPCSTVLSNRPGNASPLLYFSCASQLTFTRDDLTTKCCIDYATTENPSESDSRSSFDETWYTSKTGPGINRCEAIGVTHYDGPDSNYREAYWDNPGRETSKTTALDMCTATHYPYSKHWEFRNSASGDYACQFVCYLYDNLPAELRAVEVDWNV